MGLFSGSASTPFQDEFAGYLAEFEALMAQDSARLARFREYRNELEATRETDLDTSVGELDYGRARSRETEMYRHRFKLPLGQALTVKHAYRVAGRLPDAIVDRREESPQERHRSDVIEKMWWGIVRESNGESHFSSAAWDGSQVGSACFEVCWHMQKQMPYFRAIDPASVLVVPGVDDPHDFSRAYRFWSAPVASVQNDYRDKQFRGVDIPVDRIHGDDTKKLVTIVQLYTKDKWIRFALTGSREAIPLWEKDHNYGFVGYVVIPNLGPENRVWGWADYENVREIARYIPVALGREADVLKMTANGAFVSTNTGQSSSAVRNILAGGGVLSIKKDGKVEPINPPQMPAFAESHSERALQLFRMLGFAPGAAWGEGGAQSGSDRGLQLGPLLELTGLKQLNWGAGLSRLAQMCFKMIDGQQAGSARYFGVSRRGASKTPFSFTVGPDQTATIPASVSPDAPDAGLVDVPMDPKQLFDGDHSIRFNWQARLDQDDPAYVASELNKFAQGVQSLRTTLERLGFDAPEDEIKLIEQEAEDHPWLRQGMIKLLEMQLNAGGQGEGGGAPFDPGAAIAGASDTIGGPGGGDALATDALSGSLDGGVGTLYGAA